MRLVLAAAGVARWWIDELECAKSSPLDRHGQVERPARRQTQDEAGALRIRRETDAARPARSRADDRSVAKAVAQSEAAG